MSLSRRNALKGALGMSVAAAAPWADAAEDVYPSRPIRLMVPFSPGSSTDIAARSWAQQMSTLFNGAAVVVENRAGAGGNIGATAVARAAPDGYFLLYSTATPYAIAPFVYPDLPFKPVKDFAPVSVTISVPVFLVVNADSGITSYGDLLKMVAATPDKVSFGSNGVGTSSHIFCSLMARQMGRPDLLHVPYKNGSQGVMADVMGGQLTFAVDPWSVIGPLVKAGKLRALAVTSKERLTVAPSIPTLSEVTGRDLALTTWNGMWAPTGTPPAVIARLHDALVAGRANKQLVELFESQGTPLMPLMNLEETRHFMLDEVERWKKYVKESGITT